MHNPLHLQAYPLVLVDDVRSSRSNLKYGTGVPIQIHKIRHKGYGLIVHVANIHLYVCHQVLVDGVKSSIATFKYMCFHSFKFIKLNMRCG